MTNEKNGKEGNDAPGEVDRLKGNIEDEAEMVGAAIYAFLGEFIRKR